MAKSKNPALATIPEIIEEAKRGNIFILVDDEGRENEGDLIVPAIKCDDQKINFMAKYGRGLICLALEEKRVVELDLPLMSNNNQSRHRTAFTVSIEAKHGITTGISAFDRATTIAAAIDESKGKDDIVSPGHIFPLKAMNGGVLVRAGHTEASVDIARLANLHPSGVICEVMNDDGTMARMPDLIKFAKKHNIKIATIADLIKYRRQHEKLVELKEVRSINIKEVGAMDLRIYKSKVDNIEHIVLMKGNIEQGGTTMVRMHHFNILADCFNDVQNPKSNLLSKSLKKISKARSGVLVLIRNPKESVFGDDSLGNINDQELRNYGIGAQILSDLGVKDMILLTNSRRSVVGLESYGIRILQYKKIY